MRYSATPILNGCKHSSPKFVNLSEEKTWSESKLDHEDCFRLNRNVEMTTRKCHNYKISHSFTNNKARKSNFHSGIGWMWVTKSELQSRHYEPLGKCSSPDIKEKWDWIKLLYHPYLHVAAYNLASFLLKQSHLCCKPHAIPLQRVIWRSNFPNN